MLLILNLVILLIGVWIRIGYDGRRLVKRKGLILLEVILRILIGMGRDLDKREDLAISQVVGERHKLMI